LQAYVLPSDHRKVFYTSTRQCKVLPNLLQEVEQAEQAEEPELGGDCVARRVPAERRDCVARGMQAVGLQCFARAMPAEARDCVARGMQGPAEGRDCVARCMQAYACNALLG
jgi:hypothetical protein